MAKWLNSLDQKEKTGDEYSEKAGTLAPELNRKHNTK